LPYEGGHHNNHPGGGFPPNGNTPPRGGGNRNDGDESLSSNGRYGRPSHSDQRWQMDQVNMKNCKQSKRLSFIEKPKQFDASKDTFSIWFAQFFHKILFYELTDQEANLVFIDRIKDPGLQALVCNMLDSNPGIQLEQLASKLNLLLGGLSTSDYSMMVRQLSRATNESISSFAIRVTSCTISSIPPEEQDIQLGLKSFHLQMLSSFLNGMHNKTLHREVLKSSAQTRDQAAPQPLPSCLWSPGRPTDLMKINLPVALPLLFLTSPKPSMQWTLHFLFRRSLALLYTLTLNIGWPRTFVAELGLAYSNLLSLLLCLSTLARLKGGSFRQTSTTSTYQIFLRLLP
jgi:hypothetical protein